MANTLLIAKQATEQAVTEARDALTEQQISRIGSYYAGAVAHGRAENPPDRGGELSMASSSAD
jgi:transposase